MSRSHRYSPICSLLKVDSEDVEEAFDDFNLILPREVSNIWTMEKEGKVRFSPVRYRNEEWWKSVMRK